MPLQPAFALSANSPHFSGYTSGSEGVYVNGYLKTGGGHTSWSGQLSPAGQLANDEILIGGDAVDPDNTSVSPMTEELFTRSYVDTSLYLYNVRDDQQLLLVFGFRRQASYLEQAIQFFIGSAWAATEYVSSEAVDDETETIALLVDVSSASKLYNADSGEFICHQLDVYARLAARHRQAAMFFTGVQGFII
jgi:hypothetical protein